MTSLFMPFDSKIFLGMMFFIFLMIMVLVSSCFKMINFHSLLIWAMSKNLGSFFLSLKPLMFNKGSLMIFLCLFMFLFFSNFLSVFCFNFPVTSQVSSVLFYSFAFWLSMVLFCILKNFKGFLSHTIPEGTPLPLTIFLFLIELVSNIIRPITLMVRLVANILAGHLLMSLLSSLVFIFKLSFITYVGLNIVEMFVSLIQAYIFCTMIVLYYSES